MNIDHYSEWYLSTALCHMNNKSRIDKKCLYVTVHLKDKNLFENFNYELFDFLKSLISKGKLHLKNYPSLISCLDFEGSKSGILSNKLPHAHILLFFPQENSEGDKRAYIKEISRFLENNNYLDRSIKDCIQISSFENKAGEGLHHQMTNVINYSRKARMSDEREVMVLPYREIIESDCFERIKNKMVESAELIRKNLCDNGMRHLFYSKRVC